LSKTNKKILKTVSTDGYIIIKNFYSKNEIEVLKNELDRVEDKIEIPGSVRLKRYEKFSSIVSAMCKNIDWVKLNFFYTFRLSNGVSMRSITSDKCLKSGKILNVSERESIADYPHFDLYKR
tara:strand:- start:360 stop:725 length:366 start_codon:yes stop_codon:yes gene_type:complete